MDGRKMEWKETGLEWKGQRAIDLPDHSGYGLDPESENWPMVWK